MDKFSAAGLTPVAGRKGAAPLVAECVAGVECRLWNTYDGGDHWIFVGEVVAAEVTPECFEGRWTFRTKELSQYTIWAVPRTRWRGFWPRSKGRGTGGRL